MALTVRKRIIELLAERLRDIVDGVLLFSSEATAIAGRSEACTVSSGTYAVDFPRKFVISLQDNKTNIRVKEETLVRELNASTQAWPFALVDKTVPFVAGAEFTVMDEASLKLSISSSAQNGDAWLLRCNVCEDSVREVYTYFTAPEEAGMPCLVIWPSNESKSLNEMHDLSANELTFKVDVQVDANQKRDGVLENLIGDIIDELNRDPSCYDNTDCLTYNCEVQGVDLYDSDSHPSAIGAVITLQVKYRHKFNKTRIRR